MRKREPDKQKRGDVQKENESIGSLYEILNGVECPEKVHPPYSFFLYFHFVLVDIMGSCDVLVSSICRGGT